MAPRIFAVQSGFFWCSAGVFGWKFLALDEPEALPGGLSGRELRGTLREIWAISGPCACHPRFQLLQVNVGQYVQQIQQSQEEQQQLRRQTDDNDDKAQQQQQQQQRQQQPVRQLGKEVLEGSNNPKKASEPWNGLVLKSEASAPTRP